MSSPNNAHPHWCAAFLAGTFPDRDHPLGEPHRTAWVETKPTAAGQIRTFTRSIEHHGELRCEVIIHDGADQVDDPEGGEPHLHELLGPVQARSLRRSLWAYLATEREYRDSNATKT